MSSVEFHRMAYREWGEPSNPKVLLCLHGLTRAGSDFDAVAKAMRDQYRVICPDIAGRGASDRLRPAKLYAVPQYANDVATLMAVLDAQTLDVLGTSMGGLIAMVLAGLPNSPIRKMVVNDVGPRIDAAGLTRIAQYVGLAPVFATADEAVAYLNGLTKAFGPHTSEQTDALNRPLVVHTPQGWTLHYDPALAEPFKTTTPEGAAQAEASMWHSWESITAKTLITRGVNSDLLSRATMNEMIERGRDVTAVEFEGTGHAPAFLTGPQLSVLRSFFVG